MTIVIIFLVFTIYYFVQLGISAGIDNSTNREYEEIICFSLVGVGPILWIIIGVKCLFKPDTIDILNSVKVKDNIQPQLDQKWIDHFLNLDKHNWEINSTQEFILRLGEIIYFIRIDHNNNYHIGIYEDSGKVVKRVPIISKNNIQLISKFYKDVDYFCKIKEDNLLFEKLLIK